MNDQHDDHIWITVAGEGWAIERIEGPILHLWRGHAPDLEYATLDTSNVNWAHYCSAAVHLLRLRGVGQDGEYSAVQFYPDESYNYVARWLEARPALELAKHLIADARDDVARIILTDGGDHTVFEWSMA